MFKKSNKHEGKTLSHILYMRNKTFTRRRFYIIWVFLLLILLLALGVLVTVVIIHSPVPETSDEASGNALQQIEDVEFFKEERPATEEEYLAETTVAQGDEVLLDVVLFNQLEADDENPHGLYNGCEVTSMAMILSYAGLDVEKKDTARVVAKVPFVYEDGVTRGNPNHGFVGSMSSVGNSPGYSVYHSPMVEMTQIFLEGTNLRVIDLTESDFEVLLKEVKKGNPVWVITTGSFAPTNRWERWQTLDGEIDITWDVHSAAITGFDDGSIYVNNPYGIKDQKVDRALFRAAWEQMGSQAVVVHK